MWVLLLAGLAALTCLIVSQKAYGQDGGRSGKEVVDAVCLGCHKTGAQGAPRIGDGKAWSKRASQGLTGLTQHALNGIRQMPAHGGNPGLTDLEIARAVTYMVNQSGGRWVEPASPKDMAVERSGEQIVKEQCARCHEAGVGGAPKIGDRAAWTPRMRQGIDYLVRSAIRGHGGMPPRGGQANLTDAEIRNGVLYMFNPSAASAASSPEKRSATGAVKQTESDATQKTVGGLKIFLGFMPAESLLAYPADSIERTMHGGVPKGSGYYHLNVSLHDRVSNAPITDAMVEVRIERLGMGGESKTLEPIPLGAASYGSYVKVMRKTPYQIIVRIRSANSLGAVEARFERSFN